MHSRPTTVRRKIWPRGYTGSYSNLERLLIKWRRAKRAALSPIRASTPAPATTTATDPATAAAMPRAIDPVTGWLISPIVVAALCMKPHGLLTTGQAAKVAVLKSTLSEFVTMRWLAMRFRGIPRSKNAKRLGGWLTTGCEFFGLLKFVPRPLINRFFLSLLLRSS
jgi:hypothetical protein